MDKWVVHIPTQEYNKWIKKFDKAFESSKELLEEYRDFDDDSDILRRLIHSEYSLLNAKVEFIQKYSDKTEE